MRERLWAQRDMLHSVHSAELTSTPRQHQESMQVTGTRQHNDGKREQLLRSWLEVAEAGADRKPAGRALKCRACNGKLLLNALALQQHVASKQHLRKVKGAQMCSCATGCRWSAHAHRCMHRRGGTVHIVQP